MSALAAAAEPERGPRARTGTIAVLRRLASHPSGRIGGMILCVLIVCGIAPGLVAPKDPFAVDALERLAAPSHNHLLGTDELGRDLLSRVVFGARDFLLISVLSTAVAAGIGIPAGLLAAAGSRLLDAFVMRLTDVLLAFPYILLILAIVAILGPSLWTAMVAVGIAFVPSYARLVRAEALAVRREPFVEAMTALGAGRLRILFGTILPNIVSPVVVYLTFQMPTAVLAAAALSFLGLGAQPPEPEWGAMLVGARSFLRTAPWDALAPGLAIFASVLGLNLLGNALRDALDPKSAR